MALEGKYVDVDGIRTHYLEAGSGPTVVLFHSGEFGGCAEISWEFAIGPLAEHFHVVAPDWLGFGRTDKIHDFVDGRARMIGHMRRFLAVMGIGEADFIGNSMSGGILARAAVAEPMLFPIRRLILASGGGFSPDNEFRRALLDYDCTVEGMRKLLHGMFHSPTWPGDEAYVQRRLELSLLPGAWECTAAARFHSPLRPARTNFGQPDTVPYEKIAVPTLVMAGANDKLRLPGYAQELAARIPGARLIVYDECGHCPNIEQAGKFVADVIAFLAEKPAQAVGNSASRG